MTITIHITEKTGIFIHMQVRQRTSKSLAAATATAYAAAKHMLFCLLRTILLKQILNFSSLVVTFKVL